MACQTCRVRKVKCEGTRPICNNCAQRNTTCSYGGERKKRRKLGDGDAIPFTSAFRCVEPTQAATIPKEPRRLPSDRHGSITDEIHSLNVVATPAPQFAPDAPAPLLAAVDDDIVPPLTDSSGNGDLDFPHEFLAAVEPLPPQAVSGWLVDRILDGDNSSCSRDPNPAVWIRTDDGDEYTGPSSGLSSISDMGLLWLKNHVEGSASLCDTISHVRNGIFNHLRQPKCIPQVQWPDSKMDQVHLKPLPPKQTMTNYIDHYFDRVQTIFPILDRVTFDRWLAASGLERPTSHPSGHALLNAVIASGCRAALSDETTDGFQHSSREAWGYFQNALWYETRLANGPTDLISVQALAVMTVFAQGMSSPQRLEYTLSSTALRLAQSIALHRHPREDWNLSSEEQEERNRIFWVVYCLDKTIALRCGRPSAIYDDEISCPFPRDFAQAPQETLQSSSSASFFLFYTRFARICGKICRLLYSAAALCQPSSDLLTTANQLLADLESWKQSIPARIRPGQSFSRVQTTAGFSNTQVLVLHFSYFYALCAIHRRFTAIFSDNDGENQSRSPLHLRSRATLADGARSMILLTKYLDIESYMPGWWVSSRSLSPVFIPLPREFANLRLLLYYPMTAFTDIFMHAIHNSIDSYTSNDIALMDVAVGFLGRLEFFTSGEAAFTKMREFGCQARRIIEDQMEAVFTAGDTEVIDTATPFLGLEQSSNGGIPATLGDDEAASDRTQSDADLLDHMATSLFLEI